SRMRLESRTVRRWLQLGLAVVLLALVWFFMNRASIPQSAPAVARASLESDRSAPTPPAPLEVTESALPADERETLSSREPPIVEAHDDEIEVLVVDRDTQL